MVLINTVTVWTSWPYLGGWMCCVPLVSLRDNTVTSTTTVLGSRLHQQLIVFTSIQG